MRQVIDIKVKGGVMDGAKGANIRMKIEGSDVEIVNETLAVIQALMDNMKKESPFLHVICLKAISENPHILLGDGTNVRDIDESKAEAFAKQISQMTDKSVLN